MERVYRPCPICDGISIENIKLFTFDMDGLMPDFYYLAKCKHCGFVYANTSATAIDYERYYIENNRYSTITSQNISSTKIYNKVSTLIKKYVGKGDKVLDVGCATGGLLHLMQNEGYKNLTGLDPSKESIDKLIEEGLSAINASVYDEPMNNLYGQFDIIILSFVCEHLFNLQSAIKNLKFFLKPYGKVLCFVPNSLEYYLYPSPLPHYMNIEHINHFSPNILVRLFEDNGFSMMECLSTTIKFGSIPDPVLLTCGASY